MKKIFVFSLLLIYCLSVPVTILSNNNKDMFILPNSKSFSFDSSNRFYKLSFDSTLQYQSPQNVSNILIRKDKIEDLNIFDKLVQQKSLEVCITNFSKTLLFNQQYSDCQYHMAMMNSEQHPPTANINFIKHWKSGDNNKIIGQFSEVTVDYSQKSIRLPKNVLQNVVDSLKQSYAYCDIMQGYFHCTNFTSKDYHHDELVIDIGDTQIKLILRNLLKQCQQLKQCSFWISQSKSNKVEIGSILLRKYSTKFQGQNVYFSSQHYEEKTIIQHIENKKNKYMFYLIFLIISLFYVQKVRKSSSLHKYQKY